MNKKGKIWRNSKSWQWEPLPYGKAGEFTSCAIFFGTQIKLYIGKMSKWKYHNVHLNWHSLVKFITVEKGKGRKGSLYISLLTFAYFQTA